MSTDGSDSPTSLASPLRQLQHENDLLRAERQQLLEPQKHKDRTIDHRQHQLQYLLGRLYGRSAAKIDPKQLQLFATLLNQLAPPALAPASPPETAPPPASRSTHGHDRQRLPASLPRQKIIHDLPEEQKPCPCCGQADGRVTEVACWAHARRKFYGARTSDAAVSTQALAYIRHLYDVEDAAKEQFLQQSRHAAEPTPAPDRAALPLLAPDDSRGENAPRSRAAFRHALRQDLAIDSNASENALRRVALGRRNWLFCGSDHGGHPAAVLFSLIATCQRHKVEPLTYLRNVLTRIAAHSVSRLAELLPAAPTRA